MYNIVIHNFKDYNPFIVIIKYLYVPCVIQYIPVAYFIYISLYLLILYPYITPPLFPSPHW